MVTKRVPWHLLLAAAIGIATGGLAASQSPNSIRAHLAHGPGEIREYSYKSSACIDPDEHSDPITVVTVGSATSDAVRGHANHHGWPDESLAGGTQYFSDHSSCLPQQGEAARGQLNRYHTRWLQATDPDPLQGTYSLLTPHYEQIKIPPSCFPPNHAVASPDGFYQGKVQLGRLWHNWNGTLGGNPGPHTLVETQDWGNTAPVRQCDGSDAASTDGMVDVVRIDPGPHIPQITSVSPDPLPVVPGGGIYPVYVDIYGRNFQFNSEVLVNGLERDSYFTLVSAN